MKRIMTVILISLAVAGTAFAQKAKPKAGVKSSARAKAVRMPTANQIIKKYVQALGGKAAIQKINSRVTKGSLEIPAVGVSGTLEIYEKSPNKAITIATIAGVGTMQESFDGRVAWSNNPMTGLRDKSGVELANAKLEAELYKPLKLQQLYPAMKVIGKEKVGEKDAYVVEAKPKEGSVEKWFFDVQTGLLIRTDTTQESPEGRIPTEIYIDEYKEVDGVKVPVTLRISTPMYVMNLKAAEVKHNVPIEDTKFTKPAAK